MMRFLILFFLLTQFAAALSLDDQLSLYVREGENHSETNFYVQNSSFYLVFINCVPAALLAESGGELAPIATDEVEDTAAEYIRRGYTGCANETLSLNSTTQSIILQMPSRGITAKGKLAALEREETLTILKGRRQGVANSIRRFRDIDLVAIDSKLQALSDALLNLRRVKTESSIQLLSQDFDRKEYEARTLLEAYENTLPFYYPAAAAVYNASVAIGNAQKRYGVEDAHVRQLNYELLSLSGELNALEKDLAIGTMPPTESFARIAQRAQDLRQKAGQRGSLLPSYYVNAFILLTLIAVAAATYVRLRTPKKIASEDVPRIRKLLQKLRGIEQQEEEEQR